MKDKQLELLLLPAILAAGLIILYIDSLTPHGRSTASFYFIPVAVCLLTRRPILPMLAAAMATAFLIAGYFLTPPAGDQMASIINRGASIIVLWVVAIVVRQVQILRNRTDEETWLQTRQAELGARLRGDIPVAELAEAAMRYLATAAGAQVGALYKLEEDVEGDPRLVRTAGYAFPPEPHPVPSSFRLREGLVGQAAAEGRLLEVGALPGHYLKVTSGLGNADATHVMVMPLLADGSVRGALELGFVQAPPRRVSVLMQRASELVGVALQGALQKQRLAELLEQTQQQTEELQAQQEEMSALNEELEQQNRALLESRNQLEQQAAELEQTNQALEEQQAALNERNMRLARAEQSLLRQKEEVEQASRYKSEFLATMSHELRTPLNSILILSKLLADNKAGSLDDEHVRYAQTIYSAGNDLLNLINDILDLSKVEAGKLTIKPEAVEIDRLLRSLERSFRPLASKQGLEFRIERRAGVPRTIISDSQRLEQILRNFLSNAFKFTERGSVSLVVAPEGERVAFAVVDTGIGIPQDQQQTVFEAFVQADGTDSRRHGGTGLGLAIVRQLAHLLGGEVRLQSAPGEGSTFTLVLPRELTERAERAATGELAQRLASKGASPVVSPRQPAPSSRRAEVPVFSFRDDREGGVDRDRQILIIEDDESFARVLYDLAHEMGFSALVTPAAEEGMALARDYRPSAIVLDIRLPDQSGLAVLEQLKSDPRTRHIPVHVVSAEDFSETVRRLGAAGSMLKPVKRHELERAFRELESHISQKIKQVLVVEDDPRQRESIAQLIGGEDVKITGVDTGAAALEQLAERTYDCMIMDLNLPDMPGQEVLAQLSKSDTPYSYPPVIVYTGRDLSREEEELLRRYSSSIIVKGARSPERLLSEATLFLHRVETELPPERQRMLRELRSREVALEGARILLADDDVRNIFAISAALEAHGAQIIVARNGREALAKLEEQPDIDLVLMDVMMPEMNGLEATRAIRQQERFKKLPIIAITAKAMRDDQQRCLQAGANDYLAKPVDMDRLMSLVKVWLSSRKGV